jgi:hypothetical protein
VAASLDNRGKIGASVFRPLEDAAMTTSTPQESIARLNVEILQTLDECGQAESKGLAGEGIRSIEDVDRLEESMRRDEAAGEVSAKKAEAGYMTIKSFRVAFKRLGYSGGMLPEDRDRLDPDGQTFGGAFGKRPAEDENRGRLNYFGENRKNLRSDLPRPGADVLWSMLDGAGPREPSHG